MHSARSSTIWIIISSIILLIGCSKIDKQDDVDSNEKKFKISDFPKKIRLTSEIHRWDSILNPNDVIIKGGKLIVSSLSSEYGLFLVDRRTLKIEKNMGKIGFGPDEIPDVWQLDAGVDSSSIWVYSFSGKEFVKFSLFEDSSSYLKKIKLKEQTIQSLSMNWINQSKWIGYQNLGDSRFKIYDTLQNEIASLGPWSQEKKLTDQASFIFSQLNQGVIGLSPNKSLLVLAQIKTDSFNIFNLNNGEYTTIIGPLNQSLKYTIEGNGINIFPNIDSKMKKGYNHISVTDNYIYLLFIGKTDDEIINTATISKDIFIFDHKGNPLIHYLLDRSLKSIAVDEENRILYGITFEKDPGLAVFRF